MSEQIGELIKRYREAKHLGQEQLAMKLGLTRSFIASIENRKVSKSDPKALAKIAYELGIPDSEFSEATGYSIQTNKPMRAESPDELLERYRLAQPVSIPVYGKFHAGDEHSDLMEYVYLARGRAAGKNIEAYLVEGHCLEPDVKNGDVVIVDRDLIPQKGDLVICAENGELICGRLEKHDDYLCLINNAEFYMLRDCKVSAVVIEVIKRVRKG